MHGSLTIGKAGRWSWAATDVCSLTATQLKPLPSSAATSDTITVSLLWGPAIGCLGLRHPGAEPAFPQ